MGRKMEWAARGNHMGGIPRKMVFMAVGAFTKAVANFLNRTSVHNAATLVALVRSRPPGVPLITVSNHMSTLDDPVMWGFKGFPSFDAKLARWVLAAEDICFQNSLLSYFFRLGKCIPITRGAGIYQEHMNEALERLSDGAWGYREMILHAYVNSSCKSSVEIPHLEMLDSKYLIEIGVQVGTFCCYCLLPILLKESGWENPSTRTLREHTFQSCLDALRHPFLCGPRWRVVPSMDMIRWGLGSTAVRITEEYIYRQPQRGRLAHFLELMEMLNPHSKPKNWLELMPGRWRLLYCTGRHIGLTLRQPPARVLIGDT